MASFEGTTPTRDLTRLAARMGGENGGRTRLRRAILEAGGLSVMVRFCKHRDVPDRVPLPDALPLGAPASRDPVPAEISVDRLAEGIVLCELPTPFMMGSTNCWLAIGDEDVLCVDPGTDADAAAKRIGAALAPHGRRIEDIETILVTHTHPDHCGAASGLAAMTDASVAVGALEAGRMSGRPDPPPAVAAALLALGAPPAEAQRAAGNKLFHAPVASHRIRPLRDGATLRAGGRRWDVHVVGGHSPGHVVLVGDGMLVAGDQLLANVLPAVHIGPSPQGPDAPGARDRGGLPWASSVGDFLASMDRFEEGFEAVTVLPGHGSAFRGTARPIARARRYHRVRCELVAARLAARGPTSVWDLTLEMYAGLVSAEGIDRRFGSAAAEIAGRLEALVAAGRATMTQPDEAFVFAPA